MKNKFFFVILALIVLAGVLSACSGSRLMASGWPGITADEETAYVAFNTHIYAINLANGMEKWRFPAEADNAITFYAAPALTEDRQVIAGGYDNILYSLNADNGQMVWKFEEATDRFVGGALVADEKIFAPSSDNDLYALNLDGQTAWAAPFVTENSNWSKPAADSNCECVYLASMDHSVYSVDLKNGTQIWRSESLGGATVGTPAISEDGQLYIGTFLNELVAIETGDGTILWRFSTEGWVWASPVLHEDVVYFGDIAGNFYAVDRQSGTQLWSVQSGAAIVGKPLISEQGIYFTTETGTLHALNQEGGTRWTKEFEATLHSGPVAAGDLILIATDEGGLILHAVDFEGLPKWQFTPAEE